MRYQEVSWDSEEERTLFTQEAVELLNTLEQGALTNPPPMAAMFRAAHTLKGSGGMLGLTEWVERAHRLEDAMDQRDRPDWKWTPELQQLALETVDALRAELEGRVAQESPGLEKWELTWSDACAMPGVRAYQAWQAMNDAVAGTVSEPSLDELMNLSEHVSYLWIPTGVLSPEQITAVLSTLDDLASVKMRPLVNEPESSGDAEVSANAVQTADRRDVTIRINASTLEEILEGLGELLLDHSQLEHHWEKSLDPTARSIMDHLKRRALDLQDLTLRARMLPLDTLFKQYPRAVHDIARKLNKKIQMETRGGETELDRLVMDRLHEPVLHLLRNACDHGIEDPDLRLLKGKSDTGTIRMSAYTAQGHVHLRIEDDGAGIDFGKLADKAVRQGWMTAEEASRAPEADLAELLFRPGVSTAEKITDISGRGVGLDVVRAFLDEIHGTITVESVFGKGTTFHLELPMTMAIMTALIVESGDWIVGLPILAVERIEDMALSELGTALGHRAVPDGEAPLPVYSLAELLEPGAARMDRYVVRVKDGHTEAALAVDRVHGQQEVVVKPVAELTGMTPWLSGVSLLGDGRLALMVDVRRLVPNVPGDRERVQRDPILKAGSNQMELLVFSLSDGQRYGINVYKTREVLPVADVVMVAEQHEWLEGFLRLRGETVPVVSLNRALGLREPEHPQVVIVTEFNQTVQAFRVNAVERMVRVGWEGVEPLPKVMESLDSEMRRFTGLIDHPGMGPIQLIDYEQILAQIAPASFPLPEETQGLATFPQRMIWLADDSRVARQQVTKALIPLEVQIKTFVDGEELWNVVQTADTLPDMFVLDVEMPRLDGYTLTQRLKQDARTAHIPVLLHTSLSGHWHADRAEVVDADGIVTKFDPLLLAQSIRDLWQGMTEESLDVS